MLNEKAMKANVDLMAKMDELSKKYGIKTVGIWTSMPDHLVVAVYDAPSWEALYKMGMEPEVMTWGSYNTTEMRQVMGMEEVMKFMKLG
jgi:uncharacterized protein with GYD domain